MTQDGVDELRRRLREFARDRDGEQFHTPKNLSMALAGEVGELLESFQWLADILGVDLLEVAHTKLERNHDRFPPIEVSGRADVRSSDS